MSILTNLQPQLVWNYFEQLTQIPRESKHEEKVIEFMLNFAKEHKLFAKRDNTGNVLITKPATPGMEKRKSVAFQAHLDMVCTANKDVKIDFSKDPITPYIDGDWVKAKGTSLGADDGIGVAMCMAILTDDTIKHGPIECLFTVDEETGLTGAFALQKNFFESKFLINLDSEEEGQIYIGCAGGIDLSANFTYFMENIPSDSVAFKFIVNGLKGGHSGDEIHKGLGNANKISNRFLQLITEKYTARLADFDGGDRHNAIPRFADFIFTVKNKHVKNLKSDFNTFKKEIYGEYKNEKTDKDINLELKSVDLPEFVIDMGTQLDLTNALYVCPNGVFAMSLDIEGLTETSTNLAVVKFKDEKGNLLPANNIQGDFDNDLAINETSDISDDDIEYDNTCILSEEITDVEFDDSDFAGFIENENGFAKTAGIKVVTSQRSSIESGKKDIHKMVKLAFEINNAEISEGDGYPGWKPNPDSQLLKIAVDSYSRLFKKNPLVKAIHAGLECGLFLEKYKDLDMISIGPSLLGVHSPDEKIEIKTVQMCYDHILDILKNVPEN